MENQKRIEATKSNINGLAFWYRNRKMCKNDVVEVEKSEKNIVEIIANFDKLGLTFRTQNTLFFTAQKLGYDIEGMDLMKNLILYFRDGLEYKI